MIDYDPPMDWTLSGEAKRYIENSLISEVPGRRLTYLPPARTFTSFSDILSRRLSPMHISRPLVGVVVAVLLRGNAIAGALEDCAAAFDRQEYAAAVYGGKTLAAATVIWAAGVQASPAAQWLDAPADRAGRLKVEPDLTVPGHPEIFAIGDSAIVARPDGRPVPGIAPAAKQEGAYVAKAIRARLGGRPAPPFRYQPLGARAAVSGDLSTLAAMASVADEVNRLGRFDAVIHNAGIGYRELRRVETEPATASS
jgi:hypothetical protein